MSPPYFLEITIMVHEKILKNKDIRNASLACIFKSMTQILILFCEIWVLTPSVFGTPLRSHPLLFVDSICCAPVLLNLFNSMQNQ